MSKLLKFIESKQKRDLEQHPHPDNLPSEGPMVEKFVDSRYKVLSSIRKGSFCRVLLAKDKETGKEVALKVPLEEEPFTTKTLVREGQALGRLDHKNIIRLFESGTIGGVGFLALERIQGILLDGVPPARFSLHDLKPIFFQLCDALEAVHDNGMAHGDFKPTNVFVIPNGQGIIVKLFDFNCVKFLLPGGDPDRVPEGYHLGSTAYMAPERLDGRDFDHRDDIYALGSIIYKQLVGYLPSVSLMGLLSLPDHVVKILSRALAEDPEERFATVAEMKHEIASITS